MFHFLLILDDDATRRGMLAKRAEAIMQHWGAQHSPSSIDGQQMRLLTWGDASPEINADSWRLGIGSWIGPTEPPTATRIDSLIEAPEWSYDGTYCFLAGTLHAPEASVIVDRLGRMHVYYSAPHAAMTLISNSALLLSGLTQPGWELSSVREFLAKGTVFGQRSLFPNVMKLAPDTLYRFRPGDIQASNLGRAPTPPPPHETQSTLSAFADAVTNDLSAISQRCRNPLIDLTGGFDSRLVLACLLQLRSPRDISTVVVGSANNPDVLVANAIARKLGLRHRHIEAPETTDISERDLQRALLLTDAECDLTEYAKVMRVHESLLQEFDASINGSGGEIIRDEWWQVFMRPMAPPRPWDAELLASRRFATDTWGETIIAPAPSNSLKDHFAALIAETVSHLGKGAAVTRMVDEVYLYMRMQRWQGRIASATHGIWPNYSPLLMQRPIGIALSSPIELRRNGLMPRLLLEKLHRPLAEIPMTDGAPATKVTWSNLHRHVPRYRNRVIYYAKALHKRWRNNTSEASQAVPAMPPALKAQLSSPTAMSSARMYDSAALQQAIRQLHSGALPQHHAGRLFTLEYASCALNDLKSVP